MRKIPTLFLRNPAHMSSVIPEYHPACAWVRAGEGVATRKYDGTCVLLNEDSTWWARREVKAGRLAPAGFCPVEYDVATGKTVGWESIGQSSFAKYHAEALIGIGPVPSGTYELIGPKINGNPEMRTIHTLMSHDRAMEIPSAPRDFDGLAVWLRTFSGEGIVWHHPDGRMAKIKRRDFGFGRPDGAS